MLASYIITPQVGAPTSVIHSADLNVSYFYLIFVSVSQSVKVMQILPILAQGSGKPWPADQIRPPLFCESLTGMQPHSHL